MIRGDYATALQELRPLAEQGDVEAQNGLGFMYEWGQGVRQDDAEAVRWYHLAAEQGHASAQYNLGSMYDEDLGTPQDYVQAHKWFNLAVSRFPASEKENRNSAAKNRDTVSKLMTPAQIAEAQQLAWEWADNHQNEALLRDP